MKMNFLLIASIALVLVNYVQAEIKKSGKADMTNFDAFPDPNSDQCKKIFEGCTWAGRLTFVEGKQTLEWVKSHNIIAVHRKDSSKYKLKTFKITQGSHSIVAKVYDECNDSDCEGCCTKNSKNTGFLINMEKYTLKHFGGHEGLVEWTCLDC